MKSIFAILIIAMGAATPAMAYTLCSDTDCWEVGYCEPGNTGPGLTCLQDMLTNPGSEIGVHFPRVNATFSKPGSKLLLKQQKR